MRLRTILAALLAVFWVCTTAKSHELRPAFLDMQETAPDVFAVVWKVPAAGDMRLPLDLQLPANCAERTPPAKEFDNNYLLTRWTALCSGGLRGHDIAVAGLRTTLTDVLARIGYADGTSEVSRLTPEHPRFTVTGKMDGWATASTYFMLGVEHILTGIDHLLFVLALMLLIRNRWMLFKTITAFTIAHSITLGGAALGYFSLPQKPVEAAIALSIAFVASELIKMKPGERRLSEAYPWLVAFTFGLLHGFGFAGALTEIGLPQADVPLALLTFNLGVEAGQLLFVGFVLLVTAAVSLLVSRPLARARTLAAYLIGISAMYWLVERLAAFVT
jgi:hydrogenase/urease accessory protein HupE